MLCPKKLAVAAHGVERAARKGRWYRQGIFGRGAKGVINADP